MKTISVYPSARIYNTVLELITIIENKLNEFKPEGINHDNISLTNITYIQLSSTLDILMDLRNVLKNTKTLSDIEHDRLLQAINNIKIIVNKISSNHTDSYPQLDFFIKIIEDEMTSLLMGRKEVFNSNEFYNKHIEQLKKENNKLLDEINKTQKGLKEISSKSGQKEEELKIKQEELIQSEKKLNELTRLIKKYEAEQQKSEIINDAKKEWNGKIRIAFSDLEKQITPIKDEQIRLKRLFWGYLIISSVLIVCIFGIEYIICCKINDAKGFPTWETYLSLIVPIPIAMGGLWGFVTLMHKVQRQLVILANQIHEIKYVEGLLLTMNTLSTNLEESMSKVNSAIDKLLDNHLNSSNAITEELSLEKEEKKDTMPYEEVIKLIKGVTGIVNGKQ